MHKEQLRAARALIGWSQEDLASIAGVSVPTIKRIEAGTGPLKASKEVLEKIEGAIRERGVLMLDSDDDGGFGVRIAAMDETSRLVKCDGHVAVALSTARLALGYANSDQLRTAINSAIEDLTSAKDIIFWELTEDVPEIPE